MADLRSFAIHEVNPLVTESASGTPGTLATLHLLHPPAGAYELDIHGFIHGSLCVEEACCTDGIPVRLPDNDAGYVISFPVCGAILALHRGREFDIGPGKAVVFQPLAEVMMMMTDNNFDVLVVRIDAAALEDALEARLGYPVRRPLPLAPTLDLGTAAARGWAASLRHVFDAAVPRGLLANPVIAEPLQHSLLDGLLKAIDHPYREALDAPVRSWGPRTVRHGVDTMEAFPQRPFTMAALAADAGVSVRALEECWSRHRDVRPMSYLHGVPLARAHLDLQEHAPGETTVAATALRWGFARPAQFATGYVTRYGCPKPDPARTGLRLSADQLHSGRLRSALGRVVRS